MCVCVVVVVPGAPTRLANSVRLCSTEELVEMEKRATCSLHVIRTSGSGGTGGTVFSACRCRWPVAGEERKLRVQREVACTGSL